MNIDVVLRPADLGPGALSGRTVVVFDVLRATTTITAALAAGVSEVRIFNDLDSARAAATAHIGPRLLCGEKECLPPPGFDLGNSPRAFTAAHAGLPMFLATTNGTRAIVAAGDAAQILVGALINASAVAAHAAQGQRDITLLCAGTTGQISQEDLIGAGAVLSALCHRSPADPVGDPAQIALHLFRAYADRLPAILRTGQGGKNIIRVNLTEDIDFAARLDCCPVVGQVVLDPLRVVQAKG